MKVIHHHGHHHAVQEDGRLGHFGLFQFFGCAVEHDIRDAKSEDLVRFFKEGFCLLIAVIQVLSHTGKLRTLSGKYICSCHGAKIGI